MNLWQRLTLALGALAVGLLLVFRPYDVCGRMMCGVVYADYRHPPVIDPAEGGGADGYLLAAQWLLVVLGTATALLALASPLRRGRVVGLLVGLGVVALFVGLAATSFPFAAFDAAIIGNGIVGLALTALALAGKPLAKRELVERDGPPASG